MGRITRAGYIWRRISWFITCLFCRRRMTDKERDRALAIVNDRKDALRSNVRGLGAYARRIETGIKQGAYEDGDAPALAELVNVAWWTLQRVAVFIDDEGDDEEE